MQEITKYKCEMCNREFDSQEEAKRHESMCFIKDTPVKAIVLYPSGSVSVVLYPKAKYWNNDGGYGGNKINLMPEKYNAEYNRYYNEKTFKFDEIKSNDGVLVIYTMNLDTNHEKDCIKRLIDKRIEILLEKVEALKKTANGAGEISYNKDVLVEHLD